MRFLYFVACNAEATPADFWYLYLKQAGSQKKRYWFTGSMLTPKSSSEQDIDQERPTTASASAWFPHLHAKHTMYT